MLRKALRRVPMNNKHVAPEAIAMIIFGHKPFRAETLPCQSVFITSGLGLILEIWMLIYTYLWETMLHSLSVRTQEMTVSSSWPWYIFMLSSRLRAFYGMSFKRLHSFPFHDAANIHVPSVGQAKWYCEKSIGWEDRRPGCLPFTHWVPFGAL